MKPFSYYAFGLDNLEILRQAIKKDIPELKPSIQKIFKNIKNNAEKP
jgi:uncharacterized protein with HEPN domain